jgi:hypothetical protein
LLGGGLPRPALIVSAIACTGMECGGPCSFGHGSLS